MLCSPNGADRINSYALVAYVPDPLGSFLDGLRVELVPSSEPHAHITVLPPRPLSVPPNGAWDELRASATGFPVFEVEAVGVEVFDATAVVYLAVGRGFDRLRELNRLLNAGAVHFDEPFAYHPHITLAQDIPLETVPNIVRLARARWAEYRGARSFRAERITFVQNTIENRWVDLAECPLAPDR